MIPRLEQDLALVPDPRLRQLLPDVVHHLHGAAAPPDPAETEQRARGVRERIGRAGAAIRTRRRRWIKTTMARPGRRRTGASPTRRRTKKKKKGVILDGDASSIRGKRAGDRVSLWLWDHPGDPGVY